MTTTTTTSSIEACDCQMLGGAAAGALLMYMLDPTAAAHAARTSAAAVRNAGSRTGSALGNAWHGIGERIGSVGAPAIPATPPAARRCSRQDAPRQPANMDETGSRAKPARARAACSSRPSRTARPPHL
jgi:hypothetical protein